MISVIVPVYNVESYLNRCIDSILAQTYKDFEIILVDDGSNDNSGNICDSFSEEVENIKVIHQQNQGPAVSRNVGTDNARGQYITYIDSDDIVHPDYLKILYNLCIQNEADLSCCNFSFFSGENLIEFESNVTENLQVLDGISAMNQMLYGKIHGSSACALLIKAEIAKKIKFTPGKYHEDDLISFRYFVEAQKVAITNQQLYYYFQRQGSIMHSPYGKIALDELDAGDYIVEKCQKFGNDSLQAAYFKKYQNYIDVLVTYPELKKLDLRTYLRVKEELLTLSGIMRRNICLGKKTRLKALVLRIFGIRTFIFLNKVF